MLWHKGTDLGISLIETVKQKSILYAPGSMFPARWFLPPSKKPKLTLRQKRQIEYRKYLNSGHWQEKRVLIRERSEGYCECCGDMEMYAVHHLTYERLGCERLDDLLAVCFNCHNRLYEEYELSEKS